jgi:hypothetical protein
VNPVEFVCVLRELVKNPTGGNGMFLTPAQLIERWHGVVVYQTLANWRCKQKGPDYIKVGEKVLYPLAKVEEYERKFLRSVGANDNDDNGGKNAVA